jgi:hypothetical protein
MSTVLIGGGSEDGVCIYLFVMTHPSHCPMERSCSSRQYWWWLSGQLIRLDCALLSIISCVAQSLLNTIKLWGILRRSDSPRHRSIPLQYACLPMMGNLGVTVTLSDSIESRWERGKENVCVSSQIKFYWSHTCYYCRCSEMLVFLAPTVP